MTLRPYQITAAEWLSRRKRGLVVAPAGSGKTVIAAAALAMVLERRQRERKVKVGWLCNTQEQASQAGKALAMFPAIDQAAEVKIRCAAAGTDWFDRDVLIVDEVHHAPAPGWQAQIETCVCARWGFTATPNAEGQDAEQRDATLRELFGEEWLEIPRTEVGDKLTKARVIMLQASDPGVADKINTTSANNLKRWTWHAKKKLDAAERTHGAGSPQHQAAEAAYRAALQEMSPRAAWLACVQVGIVADEARNYAAVRAATHHINAGQSTIVLVNEVEHAKTIAECLPSAVACYSAMGAKARRHALYNFKTGAVKCIVATSLADEGLDVPIASVLVLISGGRNKAKAEQRTGRVLRTFAGKTEAIIYDFTDSHHRLMAAHSEARVRVYKKLGYEIVASTPQPK